MIAKTLERPHAHISPDNVQRFLDYVERMESRDYNREALAELFNEGGKEPKGRRGRRPGLRNEVMDYLAWTENGDRQRRALPWRYWTVHEIRFYLLTGVIPPNRYRVTDNLRSTVCFPFDKWRVRIGEGWHHRVSEELGQDGVSEELRELLADAPLFVNEQVQRANHRVASADYVRNMLAHHNYRRAKRGFSSVWQCGSENKSADGGAGSSGNTKSGVANRSSETG